MTVPGTVDDAVTLVEEVVARSESRCVSRVLQNHVDITVVREDRHRWSPCVHLEFRPTEEGTTVDGLIGPHPNLWTMYAFVTITAMSAAVFGLMYGLAQLSLDENAWALWAVLGGAVVVAIMYAVSQIGQRLAAEQTQMLTRLVEDALGAPSA